ncbi:MAG: hypothetical protein ACI9WU_001036 [Myxococcota bacterium]|jgi:hypothetical protein
MIRILAATLLSLALISPALADDPPAAIRRSRVMEFDARLIQGQTPRAGAVYLFQRAPRRLPELVRLRPRYLEKIVVPVLGRDAWKPAGK